MNRQQRRAATRRTPTVEPREERALCDAAEGQLRALIHAALAAGADPRDIVGGVRDFGDGRVEVTTESRRGLIEGLDAARSEGTARVAAGLRAAPASMGFPVVMIAPAGVYVMTVRFHLLSRGGDA